MARQPALPKPPPHACRNHECRYVGTDLYWKTPTGKPLKTPLCRDCYEMECRRMMRTVWSDVTNFED